MIEFDARLKRNGFTLDAQFSTDVAILALFGPSGSGKTTVLHLIAGLVRPDEGRIAVGGRVLADTANHLFVPNHRRRAGLVFQDAQLFPHMSVEQNLRFGRRFSQDLGRKIPFDAVVDTLQIAPLLGRRAPALSGGEKQRVALGRALLAGSDILLLDEPLASLDDARKEEILGLIARVRDEFAIPIIYVTHSAPEVRRLAGHVILLNGGRIAARGAPHEVLAG
ncbi:MAG TPA: ATP-binding cassette domain-containing protein [Hyphomicrobium sp.]|nr:ATP-binding cassette domain-containing protein [Hyphomicrobium sp.]